MTDTKVINLSVRDKQELLDSGYTEESISKIPHYSAAPEETKQKVGFSCSSLVFVYKDLEGKDYRTADGKPFRRCKPRYTEDQEASWLKNGKSPAKYLSPKGAGVKPYISQLIVNAPEKASNVKYPLIYTEGEKKADVLAQEGYFAIGLGGVTCWSAPRDEEDEEDSPKRLMPELQVIKYNRRVVYLIPDSDILDQEKPQIAAAIRDLAIELQVNQNAFVRLVLLPNELDGSKNGVDDFIKRYGSAKFKKLLKEAQPALKKDKNSSSKNGGWMLNITEPSKDFKAEICSWLLSSNYAARGTKSFYEFDGVYWRALTEPAWHKIVMDVYHSQNWKLENKGTLEFLDTYICAELYVTEDKWNRFGTTTFCNGTYNHITKQFSLTFDKYNYSTLAPLPFKWEASNPYPIKFLRFLSQATGGDQATIGLIQAILRYIWIPKDRNQKSELEVAFDFYGPKGSGKSTLLELIVAGLGEANVGPARNDVFSSPEKLFALLDKRAAVGLDLSGYLGDIGLFNSVVSNELVEVRERYKNPLYTRLGVVVIRAYNEFLRVPDGSEGLDRRILAIPFTNPPARKDTKLLTKLKAELPAIYQWALSLSDGEMVKRIKTRNDSRLAKQGCLERYEDNNLVFQFFKDKFNEMGLDEVKSTELYMQFRVWCEEQGYKYVVGKKTFFDRAKKLGVDKIYRPDGSVLRRNNLECYSIPVINDQTALEQLGLVDVSYEDDEDEDGDDEPPTPPNGGGGMPPIIPPDTDDDDDSGEDLEQEQTAVEPETVNHQPLNYMQLDSNTSERDYVTEQSRLVEALIPFKTVKNIGVDTETTGLDPHNDKIRLIQLSSLQDDGRFYSVAIDLFKIYDYTAIEELFNNPELKKVFFNAKFDIKMLLTHGFKYPANVSDLFIVYRVLYNGLFEKADKLNLAAISKEMLNISLDKTKQKSDWSAAELDESQVKYALTDAEVLLPLQQELANRVMRDQDSSNLISTIQLEYETLETVIEMELTGIPVNVEVLEKLGEEIAPRIEETRQQVTEELGVKNPRSTQQLMQAFKELGIPAKNTRKDTLEELSVDYPILDTLVEFKKLVKTQSDVVVKLPKLVNPKTGRIHCSFNQLGTSTGRFSSSEPNMQQIPRDLKIRSFVQAEENRSLVVLDYSQIELVIAAQLAREEKMIAAYNNGEDLHKLTASFLLNKPLEEITKGDRQLAKAVNFGLLYGMGAQKLQVYAKVSYKVAISVEEATQYRNAWFELYPGLKAWHNQCNYEITMEGVNRCFTLSGRRRLFNRSKEAAWETRMRFTAYCNTMDQGTGGDISKIAMNATVKAIKELRLDANIILQVHDEIVIECASDKAEQVREILHREMVAAGKKLLPDLPVMVEGGIGKNWAEAK